MSRTVMHMSRWIIFLAGMTCLLAIPVMSDTPFVATPSKLAHRTFKVCILLMESQRGGSFRTPYWNCDPDFLAVVNRGPFLPAGWTLDNPLAPGMLQDDTELRLSGKGYALDPKGNKVDWYTNDYFNGPINGPDGFVARPLTKNDPAYWVVKLDQKSLDALAKFDLLIIDGHAQSILSNADRDNLHVLLERGATIWLNNSQREGNIINNFFVDPEVRFNPGPYNLIENVWMASADAGSWLLNSIYRLDESEVNFLRDNASARSYIAKGVSGFNGGLNSQLFPVAFLMPNRQPAIAAGRIGAGQLIVTGTDIMGGTSDWWEFKHSNSSYNTVTHTYAFSDLSSWPDSPLKDSQNPNRYFTYQACSKFFMNMLAGPSNWAMSGGNTLATRAIPVTVGNSLAATWSDNFVVLNDPVLFGDYVAVTGSSAINGPTEVRVYYAPNLTNLSSVALISTLNASSVGAPVFGERTTVVNNNLVKVTVLYLLQKLNNDNQFYLACYSVSSQGVTPIWSNLNSPVGSSLEVRPSLTLSNNKLVVTTLGISQNSIPRIFLFDTLDGTLRANIGANPEWAARFRLTGPAHLVTVPVNFLLRASEAGGIFAKTNDLLSHNVPIEMLAVTGEYYPTINSKTGAIGQPVLFLVPPVGVATISPGVQQQNARGVSPSLTLATRKALSPKELDPTGPAYLLGASAATTSFRNRYILGLQSDTSQYKITFRSFDVFFPEGDNVTPPIAANRMALMLANQPGLIFPVTLSMGNPITLFGNQIIGNTNNGAIDLSQWSTLRSGDGDSVTTFGYHVDTAPMLVGNQLIVGTQSVQVNAGYTPLKLSLAPNTMRALSTSGALTSYYVDHPGFSRVRLAYQNWKGNIAWQFFGDSFGPGSTFWSGALPYLWHSDFPFAPASGNNTIYTTATYSGYDTTCNDMTDGFMPLANPPSSTTFSPRGKLYALDPNPSRYLEQVVKAGRMVQGSLNGTPTYYPAGNYALLIQELVVGPLHVGARALLKYNTYTWDCGHITDIQKTSVNGVYQVVFDRICVPLAKTEEAASLLVATSTPYVSHVRGWNSITGEEMIRESTVSNGVGGQQLNSTRLSEGISSTYPAGKPANPDPVAKAQGEAMISLTQLQLTCHDPAVTSGSTVVPNDNLSFLPQDVSNMSFLYLPRLSQQSGPIDTVTNELNLNYTVDYRTGRIALSPEMSGRYSDHFVVVHYYTNELLGNSNSKDDAILVHHADIMHVPTQVKWQYEFTDAIPDSGPTLVNDTIFVSAHRVVAGAWQPTIYSFAAQQANPLQVKPQQVVAVGASITGALPYRGITSTIPVRNGILVGTALPGVTNKLTFLSDHGTLVSDAHRLLRISEQGDITWQASATWDDNPTQLNSADNINIPVQQEFTFITKVQQLASGNMLVCDTGGNRIVELNKSGKVLWQYPDSYLSTQDPDAKMVETPIAGNNSEWSVEKLTRMNDYRQITPLAQRLNGPRDVRRYYSVAAPIDLYYTAHVGDPEVYGTGAIMFETTMIVDAGNNRIVEIQRPLIKIDNIAEANWVIAPGFLYRPFVKVGTNRQTFTQTFTVLADGNNVRQADGSLLGKTLTFTQAMRFPVGKVTIDGVNTADILAVVGNNVNDPSTPKSYIRTVLLSRATNTDLCKLTSITDTNTNLVYASINPLKITTPNDYSLVRQLDIISLKNGTAPYFTVLVVDQNGVREVDLDGTQAVIFAMNQIQYSNALRDTRWSQLAMKQALSTSAEERLTRWRKDEYFVPMAVERIDSGSGQIADWKKTRYLISQMNSIASPQKDLWMNDANGALAAQRRIHLFEVSYLDDTTRWSIVDTNLNCFIFPHPWADEFPNLPENSYPLTQPLSIDRD